MAGRPSRNTALLATILDHLPDALLLLDPMGTVVNANARALEAFKAPGAVRPLIGRVVADLIPDFGPERPVKSRHAAPAERRTQRMTARALDGTTFQVDVFRALVPWAGSQNHMLLVLHEATSAPLESELIRASQQAQAILRATEEAICGVDLNGKVVLANPAAARLLGTRLGEVAGRDLQAMSFHTRLDGSAVAPADTPVGQVLAGGKRIGRRREVFWRADGSPVPVEVSTVPIKDGETTVGAVAAITDVTRLVEEKRRRNRLLSILDAEIVPALAALSESDLGDSKAVLAELERIHRTVLDAADYEHLMDNQVSVQTAPRDLADVLDDAVEAVSELAARRGVSVDVVAERAAAAVDPHRLALAIGELLRAAVESSASGASVGLTTVVIGEGTEAKVRIGVRETKVADAAQENPLLRWLRPRDGRQAGPDPDLAFVQVVVERHGGRFLLEPTVAGARSYVVELPAVEAPAKPVVAAPATEAPAQSGTAGAESAAEGAAVVMLRSQVAAAARESSGVGSVIPMPTRSLRAVEAAAANAAAAAGSEAAEDAGNTRRTAGEREGEIAVLVWPAAAPGLAEALGERGAPAAGVSRVPGISERNAPAARVLLVDPLAGAVSRRTLGELRVAAGKASLPLVVVAGLTEVPLSDAEAALEPPALLAALRPSAAAGGARVLVLEPDPALATAIGAGLLKRGMQAVYARNPEEAVTRAALGAPDFVMLGLDAESDGRPGILDWLVRAKLLVPTPVLVYTLDGLPPGYAARLERGASVVGVGARSGTSHADDRLADLVVHLGNLASRR